MKLIPIIEIIFNLEDVEYKYDGNCFYKNEYSYGWEEIELSERVEKEFFKELEDSKIKGEVIGDYI